ncbi:membrane protein of ER body-like protein isoform X11 [Amaranthus tricolor]|uniref:membrane protein of ER body-like protein isoform X11 n=1 Tax=Amaranthus tricolor TaxID=29722 RepID=UPI00258C8139|nr:membrane protein of ER body-like protein isoform X11 [Amaranthus tricolor]
MDTNTNVTTHTTLTLTNAENLAIIEDRSVTQQAQDQQQDEVNYEEPIYVIQDGDSNGFTFKQNKVDVVEFSLPENDGRDEEAEIEPITSGFCKSSETSAGLKYVDSLLNERSNGVNGALSEKYNGENVVNKILIVSGQREIFQSENSQEDEPEGEEFDVERVMKEQKTHDMYCPNCNKCITDRVILKRRKRKIREISKDVPPEVNPGQMTPMHPDEVSNPVERMPVSETLQNERRERDSESRLEAISCFSCFSIFISKGNGFLCWRFKPKLTVTQHSDVPSAGYIDATGRDDEKGTAFPLWILTCCQPYHAEKPATDALPEKGQLASSPSQYTHTPLPPEYQPTVSLDSDLPTSRGPVDDISSQPVPLDPVRPEKAAENNIPLWILTLCQPTESVNNAPRTGTKLPTDDMKFPFTPSDEFPVHPIQSATVLDSDEPISSLDTDPPPTNEDGTRIQNYESDLSTAPSKDTTEYPISQLPIKDEPGQLIVRKPVNPRISGEDIPSQLDLPEPPSTPPKGDVIVEMPDPPKPQPSDMQPGVSASGSRPLVDVEEPLIQHLHEPPIPGIGVDILKAIVYGGLLECIISLSVITSAAGGDATTLNIVALGLANVFGGLIVLFHNIRVLKHEHALERYEQQLGRPENFVLHAVVAMLSYVVFGLISPIIYGFSFSKSDNKNYKLTTLAAASLVCIAILSVGKAHVRRPPKYFQTVFYYICMGFIVFGVGYAAGDLINTLLKKLNVFDYRVAPVAVPVLGNGAVSRGLSVY